MTFGGFRPSLAAPTHHDMHKDSGLALLAQMAMVAMDKFESRFLEDINIEVMI